MSRGPAGTAPPLSARLPAAVELAAERRTPAAARRFVQRVLGDRVPEEVVDTIVLLTSELVTNAIEHADAACRLTLSLDGDDLRVEVSDPDGRPGTLQAEGAADERERGRGLRLVTCMAQAWGNRVQPAGGGKTVWFTVDLAAG